MKRKRKKKGNDDNLKMLSTKYKVLNLEKLNRYGDVMKIVEYNKNADIVVEFQDKYKAKVHTTYKHFLTGEVKNPYYASICGIGMIGSKYQSRKNKKLTKEYSAWYSMISRCYNKKVKEQQPTYKDVTCCEGWLLYENFYEWLHEQENFDKWYNGNGWQIDKDILVKGNKIYSPETCLLVPRNVNILFVKNNINRGNLPIGVAKNGNNFMSYCGNPFIKKRMCLGTYKTYNEAFLIYKQYKESIIRETAKKEYKQGNITKRCYDAMTQ